MNTIHRAARYLMLPLVVVAAFPTIASAHVGTGTVGGFLSGLAHPLGGLDHLCAVLGVGFWAAQRGGRATWLIPLVFFGVIALGGWLGMVGVAIAFVEPGIVASVVVVGVLIAAAMRLPMVASVLLVSLFALVHGHAHGSAMPAGVSGLLYAAGYLSSSAALLTAGVGLGALANRPAAAWTVRYAGAAMVLCGVYLCLPH